MKTKWKIFSTFISYIHRWLIYIFFISFIIGWWFLAFRSAPSLNYSLELSPQSLPLKTSTILEQISKLERDKLHRALTGDFSLILELVKQWDQDAQFLINKGIEGIERLTSDKFLQVQILGNLVQNSSPELLRTINCKLNLEIIQDDNDQCIHIEDHFQRFLPQTFVAASFLLAIAPSHEILALPRGMRHFPQLYPTHLVDRVPINIDHIGSEKVFLANPHLVFIAPYSHPPTLEVLRNQKIQLFTLNHINNLTEILNTLLKIGHVSNHIIEAQLLANFMEACFLTIDNRFALLAQSNDYSSLTRRKLLFLHYHLYYMQPTTKSLTGQFMARALRRCPHLTCCIPESHINWRIPFELEKLIQFQPHYLLISTSNPTQSQLFSHSMILQQLENFQLPHIFYLDETIQESPTQFIALAYFDLFKALIGTYSL